MEWNAENLQFLSQCFLNTLSPVPEVRHPAEASLAEAANRPNYGLAVLLIVDEPALDEQIRQSAAVAFKNHIKTHWVPQPIEEAQNVVTDLEKEKIKASIVSLMIRSSPRIRVQLSEALTVIGKHDFPKAWPTLLPELVATLDQLSEWNDYVSVNGVLVTINSLFKKFRYNYMRNNLLLDLKYCVDLFAEPLLKVFKRNANYINQAVWSGAANRLVLKGYIEAQRLCCRIFHSLNFMDLSKFFEDNMHEWMSSFEYYLTATYPLLEDGGNHDIALVDDLRVAICENIILYMEAEEDLVDKYLCGSANAVLVLLKVASNSSSRERLTVTAIKLLTALSTCVPRKWFESDEKLQDICNNIVIPNVMLRDEDEELFDMNCVEFIRRDMEGSDLDTRRRIACQLLKGITGKYKDKVADKVRVQVHNLLVSLAGNRESNWRCKECAIYLVVSLATKNIRCPASSDLVDVKSFFNSVIIPEIQSQDVDRFPMLKAGALKFFTIFRHQIPKSEAMLLIYDVLRFLGSESFVVQSYAACCIEKLLLVKDGGRPRYLASDISPFLFPLMSNLFNALQKLESEENEYVMKCIMQALGVANITREVASPCVNGFVSVLNRICRNPKNPVFNHYLFESVALLIRRACEQDPSLISPFETSFLPCIQIILSTDVSDFFPYAFQLLTQLVDLNRSPLPEKYMDIFAILLSPESWKKSGNVPALVRLLRAFLRKTQHKLYEHGKLSSVLGLFNTLISSVSTDEQGFCVLNTVIENIQYDVISPYIGHIWAALFRRLQSDGTVKFIKSLIIFMSLFLVKHSWKNLVDSMNAIQPDGFRTILEQFWIPHLKLITGSMEIKLTSVASTMLILEGLSPSDSKLCGKMLDSIVTILSRPKESRLERRCHTEVPDFGETIGYNATFVRLHNAGRKEDDPLPDIKDPRQFLVGRLANLSAHCPGTYPRIISENLEPANQSALFQLCNFYNVKIV